jgi:hypothetical protein
MADEDENYVSCGLTARQLLDLWGPGCRYRAEVVRVDGVVARDFAREAPEWRSPGGLVMRRVDLSVWRRWWTRDRPLMLWVPVHGGFEGFERWPQGSVQSLDVLLDEDGSSALVLGQAPPTSDIGAFADEIQAIASLPGRIDDPRFGTFTAEDDERRRYWAEIVFRDEEVDVEFVVHGGEPPTSLPVDVRQILVRLPELFKKARVLLRRWFSREENCHIVYDDSEDVWLDASVAMDNLALESLQSEEVGVWVLSIFVYEGGGWYYEPGFLYVRLDADGAMSLDAY